ncbi:DUF6894 family protein [Mesorhizobium yinganensis]|uniref:DUF6894 family protein n=1 Tax=Mesorhizobium yinganensis TaxID=3157707 RepID=UPI0032B73132
MPRYYFDVCDGADVMYDQVGIELDRDDLVAGHAIRALPEMAHDELPNGPQRDFWVKVRDETGTYIFVADLKFRSSWLRRR